MAKSKDELSKGQKAYLTRVVNELKDQANKVIDDIKSFKSQLFEDTEENESLKTKFSKAERDISEKVDQMSELYDKIFLAQEGEEESISDLIMEFVQEFKSSKEEIDGIKSKISEYSNELWGYEDEDGNAIDGTRDLIEGELDKLKDLYNDNKSKQESLFSEIEGLLKGASTVALAKAFKDHKDSYKRMNNI